MRQRPPCSRRGWRSRPPVRGTSRQGRRASEEDGGLSLHDPGVPGITPLLGDPQPELARPVKQRSPEVGVVLVTGYGRVPGAEACDAVLGKPVDVDVLTRTVRSLASRVGADSAVAP